MRSLIILILGFAIFFGYIKYLERKGIYYPAKEILFYPDSAGLSFEEIYLATKDRIKISGWFIPHPKAKYTLLFCHGNAGNISHRINKLNLLSEIPLNIFIFDYRGYGKSQGSPTEKGIYLDSQAAYGYLTTTRRINPAEIILFGESLGTAVAIDLAAKEKVGGLIVEGAFSSGKDMATKIYPFVPKFIFSDIFASLDKIKNIEAPKLFIHSRNDEIVPFVLARKLYNSAKGPKEFIEISGGHNTAFLDAQEKFISSITSFIENLSENEGQTTLIAF